MVVTGVGYEVEMAVVLGQAAVTMGVSLAVVVTGEV